MEHKVSILVVEDEQAIRSALVDFLEFQNFTVSEAVDGLEAERLVAEKQFDLILLDLMLPKISGEQLCVKWRREDVQTPIIRLTAKGQESERVAGLNLGADDYVTKPFSLEELLARINAILRRTDPARAVGRHFTFGGLDVLSHHQEVDDNAVCIIEYANKVRASINFTYFTDQPKHSQFGLVGDGGKMIADTDDAGRYILYSGPEQNKTEYTANTRFAHQGHLGFDVSHKRFAAIVLQDLDVNEDEANRGFESLVVSLAAQMSVNQGNIVSRQEILASA